MFWCKVSVLETGQPNIWVRDIGRGTVRLVAVSCGVLLVTMIVATMATIVATISLIVTVVGTSLGLIGTSRLACAVGMGIKNSGMFGQ